MIYPGSIHSHTEYSNERLRDCIIKIPDMMNYAEELGHSVLGFTDHESISGWIKIEEEAEKHPNLKILRGNEIYLCRDGLNNQNFQRGIDKYYHFILIAKNLRGAHQIMEISTRAWKRSYMSRGMRRVPTYYNDLIEIIGREPGNVIGSSACLGGALPTQLLKYRETKDENLYRKIENWCIQINNIFGQGNFYLEMQPSHNEEQKYVNQELVKLSVKLDIPFIVTTDSHYLKKEDRKIHKAYLNAQNGEREVDDFYATTYMMDTGEIVSYLSETFEEDIIAEAFRNIEELAAKCEPFTLKKPLKIPSLEWRKVEESSENDKKFFFEKIPYLERFARSEHLSDRYLVEVIIDGIKRHADLQNEEAYNELNINLESTWISSEVNKAQWSAYYLNLQNIIDECWNAGTIVGPSRGSGGGFLLLYCLDIIQMNKLREPTQTFHWRFLNPKRASVLDIDTDIEGTKRAQVLAHLRKVYGEDRVANVATFRTEKSKSAILTAARGLGIDVDIAQYIASLIPAERGILRSLSDCMYGNEEKGIKPVKEFQRIMTDEQPDLWKVSISIEGLICGSGVHAGGIIFVDEPFINSTSLKRAPDGTLCTTFELHDAEKASLIKIDLLSVEAMDKIHTCIDLLCDYGYAERKDTLRETYNSIVGIYNIERNDPNMWDMLLQHKIMSIFQMEQQSGLNGLSIAQPHDVAELAALNSVIRLMSSERGAEQPLDKWGRFRKNINEWYREMRNYGLSEDEIEWLSNYPAIHQGICESQEGLMSLIQEERLGGNDLSFADKTRKAIAKKQGKLYEECEQEFFENAREKNCSMRLVHYVWDVLLAVQRGYSFSLTRRSKIA